MLGSAKGTLQFRLSFAGGAYKMPTDDRCARFGCQDLGTWDLKTPESCRKRRNMS